MAENRVTLAEVAARLDGGLRGDGSLPLRDVTHDSRRAGEGFLFVAMRGRFHDGHRYVNDAASQGAVAALVQDWVPSAPIPQIRVPDTRRVIGLAASLVHHAPSQRLNIIGVTGTNGKTTVTAMLEAIAEAAGLSFAKIGTLGTTLSESGDESMALTHTTPEGTDLQRVLRQMVERKVSMVAMEVSSHGLALHRVEGTAFSVAAFTNLSQDHLDFHRTMEEYFEAKSRLFDGRASTHVIDVTGRFGRRLAERRTRPVVTVGVGPEHDVSILAPRASLSEGRFGCRIGADSAELRVRPGGTHNVHNAALAAASAHHLGIGLETIRRGLSSLRGVRGRLEPVDEGQPFQVLIDYAHSPEAVDFVVRAARSHSRGRVIAVIGGAGDRDPSKRPLLGAAAALADVVVVTSDNPRSEDPAALVEEVAAGAQAGDARVICEVDRETAIHIALDYGSVGDVVLILGKGHETYQDFGDRVIAFDDREVASAYLAERWR